MGQPASAVPRLRTAIALDPDYVQAHYALGTALRKLGQTAEASRELRAAEQIQAKQRATYTQKLHAGAPE
ncbi:MAG TPA: tetratricopeptide repeat protein [Bryobacteraceae bacterium]|nr:tetratricopeptide repeat protein [Bryobacteraceae bacterium]